MGFNLINFNHEQRKLLKIFERCDRTVSILDVGCGLGRNLDLLVANGFSNVVGVDINPSLVEFNLKRGHQCYTPEHLKKSSYDILLMSHLIEHFEWRELQVFLDKQLELLRSGGRLLIVTPLPTPAFYNDFDHIKPYLPQGLGMFYGKNFEQIQAQSEKTLELIDIQFYRLPWRLQFFRRFYVKSGSFIPLWINRIGKLLFFLSRGFLGVKSGWIGLYAFNEKRVGST